MTEQFSERVRALGLPLEQIIVMGSGVLDQLGIRQADDVDVAANEALYAVLLAGRDGWIREEQWGETLFRNEQNTAELWSGWVAPGGRLSFDELMKHTTEYDGIRFVSLNFLREWKLWKGRPKDLRDVELIEQYQKEQS